MEGPCEVKERGSWRRRYLRVMVADSSPYIVLRNGSMGTQIPVDSLSDPSRLWFYSSKDTLSPLFGFALTNITNVQQVATLTFAVTTDDSENPIQFRVKHQRDVNLWVVGLRRLSNLVSLSDRMWPTDAGPSPKPLVPNPRPCPPSPSPHDFTQTYEDSFEHSL